MFYHRLQAIDKPRAPIYAPIAPKRRTAMAYDETLAQRIREAVGPRPDVSERKMFGGLCFTTGGNMFVGIVKDELMVRIDKADHEASLLKPGARPMDFTGRTMTGMLFVGAPGIETDASLAS